jgi:ubiquinone/menaquinone biosynthesis C-methylase UbiE
MQDQLQYWDNAHKNQNLHSHSLKQTSFAEEVNQAIPKQSKILELGCGEGNDSAFFAEQGHFVTDTDFSDIVIEKNRKRWSNSNLNFKVQDISQPLKYADKTFDVVYARLSLHYFTDEITRKIFIEIKRVLKDNGSFCFMCKEVNDSLYGNGTEVEADMFELDGHVRHFFSEEYVRELLNIANFQIISIDKGHGQLYEHTSTFIKVVAKKA